MDYSYYSIIKFVGFELIYYAINLSAVTSFMIFSDTINKLILFKKKT